MKQSEIQTANLLKKLIKERNASTGWVKSPEQLEKLSSIKARELWDKYGHDTLKRALKQKGCVSVGHLEGLCIQVKNLPKQQPLWEPPA